MKKKKNDGMDRLSDLPDAMIHHIFSYLDMKTVVQTSILSNRWKKLWTTTPFLNFDLTLPIKLAHFTTFVHHFLVLSDPSSNILKFRVSCWELNLDPRYLYTWLLIILRRNVQEICLDVSVNVDNPFDLPPLLFTPNLLTFALHYVGTNPLQLPNSLLSATRLKTLRLQFVKLPPGSPEGELIMGFPFLEDLVIDGCDHRHLHTLTISTPLLGTLELSSVCAEEIASTVLNLNTPKLTSLVCRGYKYRDCWLGKLPSLDTVCISLYGKDQVEKKVCATYLIKVLNGISSVTTLTISTKVLEIVTEFPDTLALLQNEFDKLKELKLEEWGKASTHVTANILSKLPYLEAFLRDRTKVGRKWLSPPQRSKIQKTRRRRSSLPCK